MKTMMTRLKKTLAVMAFCAMSAAAAAQTAEWLVMPQYSEIKYFGPDMYKVTMNGKVGIIGSDGRTILRPEYDAINLFYEGRTVFVNRASQGWQVKGVLSEDGTVAYADGTYYLLPDYMFFSEGLLPVRDGRGYYGFLDEKCRPAFSFTPDEVRPFSEGFAAIGSGETFHWINTYGEQILPMLSNGGTPYGGTNFYNGKAYLWDEDGVLFVLTDDGRTEKMRSRELIVDYLYRPDTGLSDKVTYTKYTQDYDKLWTPEERGGLWTYISAGGKLLTPFQYENVDYFSDGAAIASIDGKYGLLHVVDEEATFYTRAQNRRHVFSSGDNCTCRFRLAVPDKWKGQSLSVTLTDADTGDRMPLSKSGDNYSFSYRPHASGTGEIRKKFLVEVKNYDIKLWQGEENFVFAPIVKKLKAFLRVNNIDATADNRCYVTAVISNPSPVAITTSVTLTGGGTNASFAGKKVTLTIPAYGSKSVTGSFFLNKVVLNGWCAVKTSNGASARRSGLELKPF